MIDCYVKTKFKVKPKGRLSKVLLKLGLFRYKIILFEP